VIDLLEDSQIVAAACMEERKGKFRMITESGKEIYATSKQIIYCHDLYLDITQSREALARTLQTRTVQREPLVAEVDIPGLWEILKDEPGDFSVNELAELAFGGASDDQVSAVLRALYRERIHFRGRGVVFRPTDTTTVAAILTQVLEKKKRPPAHDGSMTGYEQPGMDSGYLSRLKDQRSLKCSRT
jgi:hypothetical protein